jgi:hypothetical protein
MSEIERRTQQGYVELADTDMLRQGDIRASNADRRAAVERLIRARQEGRIDNPAFEARHQAIMDESVAKSTAQVERHLADLPAPTARWTFGVVQRRLLHLLTVILGAGSAVIGGITVDALIGAQSAFDKAAISVVVLTGVAFFGLSLAWWLSWEDAN